MGLLRGTSAISTGFATTELDALADAVAASDSARTALASSGDAEAVLSALTVDPDAGPAAQAYLDAVRYRSLGYDVGEPSAGELPAMLLGAVRAAVASRKAGTGRRRGRSADRDPRTRARRASRGVRRPPARGSAGQSAPGRAGHVLRRLGRRPRPPRACSRPAAGSLHAARSPTRPMRSTRRPRNSRRCCAVSRARAPRRSPNGSVDECPEPSTMPRRSSGRCRHRRLRWRRCPEPARRAAQAINAALANMFQVSGDLQLRDGDPRPRG